MTAPVGGPEAPPLGSSWSSPVSVFASLRYRLPPRNGRGRRRRPRIAQIRPLRGYDPERTSSVGRLPAHETELREGRAPSGPQARVRADGCGLAAQDRLREVARESARGLALFAQGPVQGGERGARASRRSAHAKRELRLAGAVDLVQVAGHRRRRAARGKRTVPDRRSPDARSEPRAPGCARARPSPPARPPRRPPRPAAERRRRGPRAARGDDRGDLPAPEASGRAARSTSAWRRIASAHTASTALPLEARAAMAATPESPRRSTLSAPVRGAAAGGGQPARGKARHRDAARTRPRRSPRVRARRRRVPARPRGRALRGPRGARPPRSTRWSPSFTETSRGPDRATSSRRPFIPEGDPGGLACCRFEG